MSIKVLKKSISAQRYVNDLCIWLLNLPYRAEREARSDIDFSNHWDVQRYRLTVEAIVWANVQTAAHIIDKSLHYHGLIDLHSREYLLDRLNSSAEKIIRDSLSVTVSEIDEDSGPLHKRPCDICNNPGGMFKIKHHNVCSRCLEEVVQVVFARVTDPEYQAKNTGHG